MDAGQCQKVFRNRQCKKQRFQHENGTFSQFCYQCGAKKEIEKMKKEDLALYRIERYNDRINCFAKAKQSKSLDSEVAISRMVLEEHLRACHTDAEMLRNTPSLMGILDRITKLVPLSHRLETQMGNSINKNQLIVLAETIIRIIADNIEDAKLLETISESILEAIQDLGVENEDK